MPVSGRVCGRCWLSHCQGCRPRADSGHAKLHVLFTCQQLVVKCKWRCRPMDWTNCIITLLSLFHRLRQFWVSTMAKLEPLGFWICVPREFQNALICISSFFQILVNKGLKNFTPQLKVKSQNHFTRAYDGSSEAFWCTEYNAKKPWSF